MSYSLTSSRTQSQVQDVFLSFRGEDTRNSFVSHLYEALKQKGIVTYKDDRSLEVGNSIKPGLLEAIDSSRSAIVVLSSNFATSKWCLEEIAKIVDLKEQEKLLVIPVFYHVDPSDVRHQSNCFQQGFANHEADPEVTPEKVETWRLAFEKMGGIKGEHVTPHRIESEVITKIIRKILKHKQNILPKNGTNRLVGIESRVNEVKRILSIESSEVRFIGICGMSGIGKTTLAEEVYRGIRIGTRMDEFQGRSFIQNIKDVSKENDQLYKLQQKLLVDILQEESIRVGSAGEGRTLLETMLRGLKVFIVLDDVNHLDQLTYLAGEHGWFGPGTRIIITTTNIDLLNARHINEIYRCEELKGDDALRLFYQSAFKGGHPTHDYKKLSDDMVKLAGGLPLALTAYGSLLCGKEENYWKEMLKKLQEYPPKEVLGRLAIVYARLDRGQQNAFIYIACFLKGRNVDLVKDILRNIGLYPDCEVANLSNKFLITTNHDDSVWMHDLLQQMCWEVLHENKSIAIKYRKDVVDVLSSTSEGKGTIEIINQEPYKVEVEDYFDDPECFSKIRNLKFLRISKVHFRQGLNFLSNDLRILEWDGCSLKSLPSTFEPTHIYELEMCSSQLETLWEKYLDLPNLRSINLGFSKNLTKLPDLTSAVNLVKLNLEGCTKLTKLHESILVQKKLRYMNLKGCTSLTSLGRSTMEMESLEALVLSGCSKLEYIPELGDNMRRLEHLFVDRTSIKNLPHNLGEKCDLRKLDASETSIQELPSSFRCLKRLRLLRVHRCRLLSKTGGFLYSNLGNLSSGLRELDLSYCNLSEVPNDIGKLYRIINLDLSGNDFVSLPASLSLLSELRVLCLNNCKRLQSLPKLPIVNKDTLQIRFNYYISGEETDVSKVHITSNNSNPTVSCLNCPKLSENERGHYLAEKILNSYLQLRTNYWITPEAVFEIIGGGSKIPFGLFKMVESDGSILKVPWTGPWIGVAICAIVDVRSFDASLETKCVVTAHIYVGERHWKIPAPINCLVAGLKNQLVFYWTASEDLHRTTVASSQPNVFFFSFSSEPEDGHLQVTKFGVCFICNEDMLQLKLHEPSKSVRLHTLFHDTLAHRIDMRCLLRACEADTDLRLCPSFIHDLTSRITKFILEYGEQEDSLGSIHKIIKCLLEVNQEVLNECMKKEWRHAQLFPLVYDYYLISHRTSELYNEFVRLLKEVSDSWLSTKLALEQIVLKSRADDYTYEQMLQQLNYLEADKVVRFPDDFVTLFAHICKQTATFPRHLCGLIQANKKFTSVRALAKVSCITIAGVISMVATYTGNSVLLQEVKDIMSNSMWFDMVESFSRKGCWWYIHLTSSYCRELQIWDFNDNASLLQELKNKMARSTVTKKNEEEMMIVVDKLGKKTDSFSKTIEDMSSLAHEYSSVIRKTGMSFNQFIAKGKLQVTKFGVRFAADEDILMLKPFEDPMREAVSNLIRATAFLPADMHSYISACEADSELYSCASIKLKSILTSILKPKQDLIKGIPKVFEWLKEHPWPDLPQGGFLDHEIRRVRELGPSMGKELYFSDRTPLLCTHIPLLRSDISSRWMNVSFKLENILRETRAGNYTYGKMLEQLDVEATESVGFSNDVVTLFESICDETTALLKSTSLMICHNEELKTPIFLRRFNLGIKRNKELESRNVLKLLGNTSRLRIIGLLSIVATCIGDFELLQEMYENLSSNSTLLHMILCFSRKSGKWLNRVSDGPELQAWDLYGNGKLIQELKKKMGGYSCLTNENEQEMMIVIDKLKRKLNSCSFGSLTGLGVRESMRL